MDQHHRNTRFPCVDFLQRIENGILSSGSARDNAIDFAEASLLHDFSTGVPVLFICYNEDVIDFIDVLEGFDCLCNHIFTADFEILLGDRGSEACAPSRSGDDDCDFTVVVHFSFP